MLLGVRSRDIKHLVKAHWMELLFKNLWKNFKYCSNNVKDHVYRTYCTGMYGGHLWCKYTRTVYTKSRTAYNCILGNLRI